MSTSQTPTTDTPDPTHGTEHSTTFSPHSETTGTGGQTDATPTGTPPTTSWVDRCQRQFSTTDANRLGNLADDANEAMPDGV